MASRHDLTVTDDRAADADAIEIERGDLLGRMPAQILVIRALHHAIQRLIRLAKTLFGEPLVLGYAALRPTVGAFHGAFLVSAGVHQRGQLVEGEHDVGADLVLDAHGDFGGEPVQRAVERRLERYTVLVHEREPLLAFRDHVVRFHAGDVHGLGHEGERLLEARAERQHLEAAGIGEGRAVPVHELRQSAGLIEHLLAGAFVQVERVGQQALRAKILHGFGQHGLHRGLRGHRHERRGVDVAVGGVDDAGASVARAAAPLAIGRIWQAGFLLEVERVAAAGLAGFRADAQ